MDPAAAKQQIAERVKQAGKFLVTVNANPTVDQLAACIGLSLLLNKMGKHATAVFSGKIPNAIQFLEPEKTIQKNADGLRDFIISLDKNKADKLRYKVEDNVVRIFITPYKTSLSEKDLVFSEGDFNVEAVIALGVKERTQLDSAITAHGRILHDATVITVNAGVDRAPDIGQINWADASASSLSEMLVSISEALGTGLIDNQIATAFLTGIVAETDRFSNKKTSPKVMTMSAQLMAAGANQQLIVSKLAPPPPPKEPPKPKQPPTAPPPKPVEPNKPKQPPLKPDVTMDVPHTGEPGAGGDIELGETEIHIDEQGNLHTADDLGLVQSGEGMRTEEPPAPVLVQMAASNPAPPSEPEPEPGPGFTLPDTEPEPAPEPPPQEEVPQIKVDPRPLTPVPPPVSMSPTTSLADSHHSFMGMPPVPGQPDWAMPYDLTPMDPLREAGASASPPPAPRDEVAHAHDVQPPGELAGNVDAARSAVEGAYSAAPFDPAAVGPVQALNAQPVEIQPPEAPPPAPQSTDTPMLVLPTDGAGPVSATPPPPAAPPEITLESTSVAPPPVPPPLVAGSGIIVPPPRHD